VEGRSGDMAIIRLFGRLVAAKLTEIDPVAV
jgi:hypothetical protein